MGIFWAMTRRPLIASLLTLAACGGSEGRVPATCGLAAVAAASTLLEQFTVPGRTLSSPPASLPERAVVRVVAGGAFPAVVGRTDTLLVIGPEHAGMLAGDGWRKADVRRFLFERLQRPVRELVPGRDGGEGLPEHVLRKFPHPETEETRVPKFRAPEHIKIVVAGGTAGRFSAIVPGWSFSKGSNLVLRRIR